MARKIPATLTLDDENDREEREGHTIDGEIQTDAERDADRAASDQNDDVIRKLTELDTAGEARWQVTRVLPSENAGYVFDLTTAELQLSTIKKRAGAGKYVITGFRPNGQYIKRITMVIAKDIDPPASQASTMLVPTPYGPGVDWQEFIARQKMAQKEELKFWAGLLFPLLGPVILEWMKNAFKRGDSMAEMVAALKGLKEMSEPADPLGQLTKLKGVLETLQDLGGEKTGSTGWDILRDVAKDAAPILGAVVSKLGQGGPLGGAPMAQPHAPMGGTPGTPGGTPSGGQFQEGHRPSPQQPQDQGEANPMLALLAWLRPQLGMLTMQAQRNKNTQLYADLLIDNVPENIDPKVIFDFLSGPQWWQQLCQFYPPAQPYQGWFSQLREDILEVLKQEIPDIAGNTDSGPK